MATTQQICWKKWTPTVTRHWLSLVAGLMWLGVGILLCARAAYWLLALGRPANVLGALLALISGVVIYRFGFSRIAKKNIRRIEQKPETVCLFAFQAWKSYILIVVMMLLGYTMRHSSLPLIITAFVYLAIGTALSLSSSLYYRCFVSMQKSCEQ